MTYKGIAEYLAITLTTGADYADNSASVRNGGILASDFKFTSGNETVTAGAMTLEDEDVLIDVSSTDSDTLNATLGSATAVDAAIQGIENINLTSTNASAAMDFSNVTGVKNVSVTGTANVALNDIAVATVPAFSVKDYDKTVTINVDTLAGTTTNNDAETISIALSGMGSKSGVTLTSDASGTLETLNIASNGSVANEVTLDAGTNVTLSTVNITGSAALTVKAAAGDLSGLTIAETSSGKTTLSVDMDGNGSTTVNFAAGNISGITDYILRDSTVTSDVDTFNLINVAAGSTITLAATSDGSNAISVKGAASGTADSLNIVIDNDTAATDTTVGSGGSLTISDVETMSIRSTGASSTGGNEIVSLVADDLKSLTITGDSKLTIALADYTGDMQADLTVDASALSAALVFDGSALDGSSASGTETLTVRAGSGDNTITATADSSADNSIVGGSGKDEIRLAEGTVATVTGGAGVDTIRLGYGDSATAVAANQTVVITDFAAGSTGDVLNLDGTFTGLSSSYTVADVTSGTTIAADKINIITYTDVNNATNLTSFQIGGTSAAAAVIVALNATTGYAEVYAYAEAATSGNDTYYKIATLENITTLVGIDALVAANFSFTA